MKDYTHVYQYAFLELKGIPEDFEDYIVECKTKEEAKETVKQIINAIFNDVTKEKFIEKLNKCVEEMEV